MRHLLTLLLLSLCVGCVSDRRIDDFPPPIIKPQPGPPTPIDDFPLSSIVLNVPPGKKFSTPRGVEIWLPDWVTSRGEAAIAAVVSEIDGALPKRDARFNVIKAGAAGAPPGWRVVIMGPDFNYFSAQHNGAFVKVYGITLFHNETIYVATGVTQPDKNGRWLPALAHEYGHAWVYEETTDWRMADANDHPLTPYP